MPAGNQLLLWQVYGSESDTVAVGNTNVPWTQIVVRVSEFLKRTGLTYCEFLELWQAEFVKFQRRNDRREGDDGVFPECEPCCLDTL